MCYTLYIIEKHQFFSQPLRNSHCHRSRFLDEETGVQRGQQPAPRRMRLRGRPRTEAQVRPAAQRPMPPITTPLQCDPKTERKHLCGWLMRDDENKRHFEDRKNKRHHEADRVERMHEEDVTCAAARRSPRSPTASESHSKPYTCPLLIHGVAFHGFSCPRSTTVQKYSTKIPDINHGQVFGDAPC